MPSENHIKAGWSLIEDKSKVLGLTIGSNENVQPGTWLPRKATAAQEPPKLSFTGANPTSTYLVVSLDIDAPFPSFGILGPILHWIQSDIKVTSEGALEFDAPFVANYIGPAPPPVSAPHRYLFFLYEQPADFDLKAYAPASGKKLSNSNRIRYDLDAWAEEIKLGPLVAFNYFTCN
ncbi:Protease inhibitor (Tfs1), putative [Penicillium digitatum PHI26]|uniref:Protease inhibitor (Tfs1), putative n=2 Tax=Penicillium digitatum TaxID=36651 RepID=K9G197_PEND2|nr:Protease inhibitor (Tfs1), putative [Penicillium digitatum Pd1]EKV12878.1 Protease inhibitor (Tfs1), putative [Penicillium digitatum Pd1]EKV14652.1 Protease inhibitor (Tfs1), putative [Penicillium digitatum PHI26]